MEDHTAATDSTRNETEPRSNGYRGASSSQPSSRGSRRRFQSNRGRGRSHNRGKKRGFGSIDRGGRHKKADMGRGEWSRNNVDKRQRNEEEQAAKRRKIEQEGEDAVLAVQFSKEEIDGEARKPKRKVAVMIGYAGTGYKGMQINGAEKTIEGDLFKAFVEAGAISKANADDPKKSSLVRCARTDKGVHAAGNVISLKLIVEDPKTVQNINAHLPPQIRVWGIERTTGSFSCYQTCDSRWYEYLIPTYSFLPPHPQSFLGKKLVESAEKERMVDSYESLQEDVASFWETAEDLYIKPILEGINPEIRADVMAAIHILEEESEPKRKTKRESKQEHEDLLNAEEPSHDPILKFEDDQVPTVLKVEAPSADASKSILSPIEVAIKAVKAAYISAKKAYRISDRRKQRVQDTLNAYLGTCNFHNYTIQKTFSDPSAKRVIRSFKVGQDPIIINDTEWLSLKVHGQSFMMHQIRKMVAMTALVVRCGTPIGIIGESYGPANISIPKAPGLGLLLERPVFDSYNERAVRDFSREKIDFDRYQKDMDEFKQREIYDRIFREEEKDHQFHTFFHHIDHYRSDYFLWVTASGTTAAEHRKARNEDASDDEEADANGEEG